MKFMDLEHYDVSNFLQLKEYEKYQWFVELKKLKPSDAFGSCANETFKQNNTI